MAFLMSKVLRISAIDRRKDYYEYGIKQLLDHRPYNLLLISFRDAYGTDMLLFETGAALSRLGEDSD
jgi:hypothetical protein